MSFNAKDMTQGGQIASMRIRMFSQIANIMLYCLFIFFWILVGLVLWVKISWQTFVNGCIYWWCTTLEGMRDLIKSQPVYEIQYYGKTFRMNAAQVLHDKYMIWCGEQLWSAFVLATVVALVICLITFFVVSWILGRQGSRPCDDSADCWSGVVCREILTPFLARRFFPGILRLSSGCAGRSGTVTGVVSLAARG